MSKIYLKNKIKKEYSWAIIIIIIMYIIIEKNKYRHSNKDI